MRVRPGPCGWGGGCTLNRRGFTGRDNPRDGLAYGNIRAGRGVDARENTVSGRFDFDHRFVGFDFEKRFTLADAVALLLAPGEQFAGFLCHLKGRHYNAEGHSCFFGAA